jgi:Methane oxygenase PmoA
MVEILELPEQFVVRIGGQEFLKVQVSASAYRPYLYPMRAANGLSFLADAPTDHRHHHGIWIGHGRVNESDFWLERHNSGRILQKSYAVRSLNNGEAAELTSENHWIDAAGDLQLTDQRTLTFYDTPSDRRWFDIKLSLHPAGTEPALLYPTNEAGLPHFRAANGLTVRSGGTLVNAEGKINERGTYRQRSAWLDCSGRLGRLECGFAVFDHPDNPDHPTRWFTRDYGPFSPNYGFFEEDPIEITPDEPLTLQYRIYVHNGDAEAGGVAEAYQAYATSR